VAPATPAVATGVARLRPAVPSSRDLAPDVWGWNDTTWSEATSLGSRAGFPARDGAHTNTGLADTGLVDAGLVDSAHADSALVDTAPQDPARDNAAWNDTTWSEAGTASGTGPARGTSAVPAAVAGTGTVRGTSRVGGGGTATRGSDPGDDDPDSAGVTGDDRLNGRALADGVAGDRVATKAGSRPPGGPKRAGRRRKRRSPLWAKLVIALGVLIMLASGAAIYAVRLLLHEVDVALPQTVLIDHGTTPVTISGPINILMVGLDTRPDNPANGSRSDSIIIAHIPASHDRVNLVSIPRDSWVHIPTDSAAGWAGGMGKINSAFLIGSRNDAGNAGGMKLLQQTILELTGITFQGALIVDFQGFTEIVNKLGGVWMTVDEKTTSLHHGVLIADPTVRASPYIIDVNSGTPLRHVPGTRPVIYYPGYQHLSAYDALDYVRIRDGLPNADYDRQRHQQQFIKALLKEVYEKGLNDPTKINSFLTSLGKAFQWDGGGRDNSEWIFTLKGINPDSIVTLKTNEGTFHSQRRGGQSTEDLDETSLDLFHAVRDDTVDQFIAQHPDWVTNS